MELNQIFFYLTIIFGFMMAWGIGANDVSNAMGTSVGSKAITFKQAILIAIIFEFLGSFLAGSEVTITIREHIIDPHLFSAMPQIFILGMLAALLASGVWLMIANSFGLPISTTHSIIGAIVGFGITTIGSSAINWQIVSSIVLSWILSPIIGAILAYGFFISSHLLIFNKEQPIIAAQKIIPIYILLASWTIFMIICSKLNNLGIKLTTKQCIILTTSLSIIVTLLGKWLLYNIKLSPESDRKFHYTNVEKLFSILMLFTACAMAFAHGSNDVANAIGPVAAIIDTLQAGKIDNSTNIPLWILIMGALGIISGLTMYGYKVIATIGSKITHLTPSRGFAVTLAAAITVVLASNTGLPISTTHTIVGGVIGIGLARGLHAINLNVVRSIVISWLITVPAGFFLAILFFYLLKLIFVIN